MEVVSVEKRDNVTGKILKKKGTFEDVKDKRVQDMYDESNFVRVGMSKGVTLNMGGYQSARIDVWISKPCPNNDILIEETLNEVAKLIEKRLEYEASQLGNEE